MLKKVNKKSQWIEQRILEDWLFSHKEQEEIFLSAPIEDPHIQDLADLENLEDRKIRDLLFREMDIYPDGYQGGVFDPLPDVLPDWAEMEMIRECEKLARAGCTA